MKGVWTVFTWMSFCYLCASLISAELARKKGEGGYDKKKKATNILLIFSCKMIKHIINILPTIRHCYNHGCDHKIADRLKRRPSSVHLLSSPALAVFPCCTSTQMIEDTVCNIWNTLNDNGFICYIKKKETERQTKELLFSFKCVICLSLGCEEMCWVTPSGSARASVILTV